MAVQLAVKRYFGEDVMASSTAGTLDSLNMKSIKTIILSKFGVTKSEADREKLQAHCKIAIGQKCKQLRAACHSKFLTLP